MASVISSGDETCNKLCLIQYSGVLTLGGRLDAHEMRTLQEAGVEVLTHFDFSDVKGMHSSAPDVVSGRPATLAAEGEEIFCSGCNPSGGIRKSGITYCIMYLKDYTEDEMMLATANESGFDTGYTLSRFLRTFPKLYNVNDVVATITAHSWIYDFGILQPRDVHYLQGRIPPDAISRDGTRET
jgi:hypothetical protein